MCGLHFTMTWHQLGKAARRSHEKYGHLDAFGEGIMEWFEEMAASIPETRGKKPTTD